MYRLVDALIRLGRYLYELGNLEAIKKRFNSQYSRIRSDT